MTTDFSKYGKIIEEENKKESSVDFSQYGTPATPETVVPEEKGETGLGGFATGFTKSLLGGAMGTASLLQGAGQRIIAGATGQKYADVKAKTGIEGLKSGSAENLRQEEILKRKGTAENIGGAVETVGEFVLPALLANKAYKITKTLDYLKNTPETLSKLEEKAFSLGGKIKTTLSGAKKVLPSETEIRASEILKGKISGNVTKNPPIIQKEIATRGQEAEEFLTKNKLPVSAQEQADMFGTARKGMEKYATKTELKAYDEQMQTFLKQLPGRGGYTTDNFYKALKEFEQNVTSNLPRGKAALLGDSQGIGSARIRAAQDIRYVVRDMIGKKHPEFKPKMFDIASLYDVLDTALTKSRLLSGNALSRFAKNNPTLSNAAKIGAGVLIGKTLLKNNSGTDKASYNPLE